MRKKCYREKIQVSHISGRPCSRENIQISTLSKNTQRRPCAESVGKSTDVKGSTHSGGEAVQAIQIVQT